MSNFNKRFSIHVEEKRAMRRWTQEELAKRVGMKQPTYSKRIKNQGPWNGAEIDDIAKAFGQKASDFIAEAGK